MKTSLILVMVGAMASSGSALANEKLVREKQCLGCHAINEAGAAPSFHKIAQFWKGLKGAEARMVATIRQGSAGTGEPHWNKATMPDQSERPLVSEAEAQLIAKWILTQ